MTDVAVQAVLTLSVTTNVPAQPTFICVWEDFSLCFEGDIALGHSDDCRRGGFNNRHTRTAGAGGSLMHGGRRLGRPLHPLWFFFVRLAGEEEGREGHGLSCTLVRVAFPSRADLTEGHCAHLRTSFTVAAPGFAHRAAAHVPGDGGRQRVLAASRLGRYQEALSLLSWRLNTSIPLQDITGLAGTFETAQCVQTVSVLTDALQGAFVDVLTVSAVESFVALWTGRVVVLHNGLFD